VIRSGGVAGSPPCGPRRPPRTGWARGGTSGLVPQRASRPSVEVAEPVEQETLARQPDLAELTAGYGFVVIDETGSTDLRI
jgi:hypothetical protein